MHVVIICSTSNNNLKLAQKLSKTLKAREVSSEIINLEDNPLPLYDTKKEALGVPKIALSMSEKLINSNGLIFVAPEYNGSIPPNLSNFVAWISRSGEDWRAAFNNKFTLVATHSGGGGQKVVEAMRRQLEHVGAVVLPRSIITNYATPAKEESLSVIFDQYVEYLTKLN